MRGNAGRAKGEGAKGCSDMSMILAVADGGGGLTCCGRGGPGWPVAPTIISNNRNIGLEKGNCTLAACCIGGLQSGVIIPSIKMATELRLFKLVELPEAGWRLVAVREVGPENAKACGSMLRGK